uniref:Putative secreted peptide n=1 Tax=Anopheles braziliensis TaxID=58242 RepID=A0A2M3ZQ83_9DIPT
MYACIIVLLVLSTWWAILLLYARTLYDHPKLQTVFNRIVTCPNYLPLTQLVYFYIQHLTIHNDTLSSPR